MGKKSVGQIILSNIIGFLIFLILLAFASYLKQFFPNQVYINIVNFFINNLWLSFLIFIATLIAEIVWSFSFPFNIIAPILSAVTSIFIVQYLYNLWIFLNLFIGSGFEIQINTLFLFVFWAVIVVGYIILLSRAKERIEEYKEDDEEDEDKEEEKPAKKDKSKNRKKEISWDDVGAEFRQAFYNIGNAFKRATTSKKKK